MHSTRARACVCMHVHTEQARKSIWKSAVLLSRQSEPKKYSYSGSLCSWEMWLAAVGTCLGLGVRD